MGTEHAWQFLAELLRQLDDGASPTGVDIGAAIGLDRAEAEKVVNQLRRRELIETVGPRLMHEKHVDMTLAITAGGVRVADSGRIEG